MLTRIYDDHPLSPDSSFQFDLGVDSLEWLNLTLQIQNNLGIDLDEETVSSVDTVRDLLTVVAETPDTRQRTNDHGKIYRQPESYLSDEQRRWLRPLPRPRRALAAVLYVFLRPLLSILFRIRVEGRENLPDGTYLLVPNHTSYLDPFMVGAGLGYRRLRSTWWAGAANVAFRGSLLGFLSRLGQAVPVEAGRGVMSTLAFGAALLQRHRNLVWFPEGGRSPTGDIQPFKPGVGMLLENMDVTVVPVGIRGAAQALPPGVFRPRFFSRITVRFGTPVQSDELKDRDREETLRFLEERVADLSDQPPPSH